uniref:C-type lectin domain-containing protein n=1 Tax=Nothoprocta perdicaria TaxID=30464 RepID=A0A8C6YTS5_NOTPE
MVAAGRMALLLLGCAGLLRGSDTRPLLYCPPGWSYYKLSCFKHFAQMRSWDEAEAQCQASQPGAHLAWVQEPREAATMRKVLSSYQRTQPVWIGLRLGQPHSPRLRRGPLPRHVVPDTRGRQVPPALRQEAALAARPP